MIGAVVEHGKYVIERPTHTLSAVLAKSGSVTIDLELAQIMVIRGLRREKVWLRDLNDHPKMDIAMQSGDRLLIEMATSAFTSRVATGSQGRIPFPTQTILAI